MECSGVAQQVGVCTWFVVSFVEARRVAFGFLVVGAASATAAAPVGFLAAAAAAAGAGTASGAVCFFVIGPTGSSATRFLDFLEFMTARMVAGMIWRWKGRRDSIKLTAV